MSGPQCPNRQELADLVLGRCNPELLDTLAQHVEQCPACQETIAAIGDREDTLVAQIRRSPEQDPFAEEPGCQEVVERAKSLADVAGGILPSESDVPQPRPAQPETGEPANLGRLGEYQLLAELRKGGMGKVYKAQQTRLKKIVALKVLPKERATNAHAVTRFEREMETVGQLDHPNIVHAHDARDIEGTNVLVMEYVDGNDLAQVVERVGRLRISDACELVRQTALGLQYAYEHGMIHRDIKPSNLMLTPQGHVKILDFGLALLGADQTERGELTSPGLAMGTADYIAPEQILNAHSVDIRADIYSLGCTLYKLLTGHAPFGGPQYKTNAEKLVGHMKETPQPVRLLRADVTTELTEVIERMMAKVPTDRFATPAELAEAMAPFAAGCDLMRVSAEASATAEGAVAVERASPATDPFASSAVLDTDATGSPRKEDARERTSPRGPDSVVSRRPPRFRLIWIAVGGASLFAVMLLGVLIKLQTSQGKLIVEVDDPSAIVQVLNEKNEVQVERKGEKGPVTIGLAPGKGRLRLMKDGVQVFAQDFSLVSGGEETIKARLEKPDQTSSEPWSPAVALFDANKAKEYQETCAKQLGVPVEITNSIGTKFG